MTYDPEEHDLVSVHECASDDEANIIIALLKTNGIEAFLNSDLPHMTLPVVDDAEVLVNESDKEEALKIIRNQETASENEDIDDAPQE